MKIKVEKGVPVDLDRRRRTSVKGGIYDISDLPKERQVEILKIKGVSRVPAETTKKKEA